MSTWREQLAFAPLESAERGGEVGRRLRHAIELGVLEDGVQLPSESDLAAKMGVSKITLRAALAELREAGLLETRRGKSGGSFVKANIGAITRVQRRSLARYSLEDLRDMREYRAFLAGTAAAEAAARTRRLPMGRLVSMSTHVRSCSLPADAIRADSQFHIELAAASGSARLTRQEMALQAEASPLIWVDPVVHAEVAAEEHVRIMEAIKTGDAVRARALAEEHVRRDMNLVIDEKMSLDGSATDSYGLPVSVEKAVAAIESLASAFARTAAGAMRTIEQAVRADLEAGLSREQADSDIYSADQQALSTALPLLYGAGFVADPSYFGESWIAWCYTPHIAEPPQRLYMDMDLYDFATAPWRPDDDADDSIVHVSDAYVDASGTNENIVTFSRKVTIAGRYAGAVAADILVSQLQTSFEPFLRALPPNTCVTDRTGAIIATNTGRFVGGSVAASDRSVRRLGLPGLPWQLHIGLAGVPETRTAPELGSGEPGPAA